jgi:pSer/pThr/pTyr-binding forkhead associated (FHA) protein
MKVTFTFQDGLIQSFPIRQKAFVIGRAASCHVSVKSSELSREHCRVDIVGQTIYLTDLNSSNGVYVDNVQLRPDVKTKYTTNQQLHMGDCYVVFDLSSEELTRSMINIRPLLESENQAGVTRIRKRSREVEEQKRESVQSTVLTLFAWALLLTCTFFLASSALFS